MWQPEPQIATFESVILIATATRMTASLIEELDRLHTRLRASYPEGVSILILRDPNSEPLLRRGLDPLARERGAELMRKNGKSILGCAYVHDDDGFFSAMVRMALTSMSLIAPFNARIFRRTDEAVDWICRLPGQPLAVRDGRQALIEKAELLSARLRMARAG